jgi:hypothetical protein
MKKKNVDIREMAKLKGVYLWQIADKLEMDNGNFSKKLRKELSENEKRKIYDIIEIISKENTAH